ncbi:RimJ/RimL family protein N-acetyltransferase [Lentzea atacamensis]|uniref:RimJ/RimL family protein N-acetyltransferase n=1 Tax=Lentzea atacamensis TaxID=531938 RepID=A0A316HNZ7_9PSEU|nr:GNAT family protein [Lentzea atacamensis]PWK81904.1 RimJ/RimL family protein N-acetyltransferase [Lentzea atacamensis]
MEGKHVRLEPLSLDHAEELFEVTRDPAIWTWLLSGQPRDVGDMRSWIAEALEQREAFAQIEVASGRVVGTTSFYEVVPAHRRLVIGFTIVGSEWQGTAINPEAKLLLLSEAFDVRGALRVAWYTDAQNVRSQRAIEKLGAVRDGVLRAHMTRPDGTQRDTVVYSMVASEWPAARERLTSRVSRDPSR